MFQHFVEVSLALTSEVEIRVLRCDGSRQKQFCGGGGMRLGR